MATRQSGTEAAKQAAERATAVLRSTATRVAKDAQAVARDMGVLGEKLVRDARLRALLAAEKGIAKAQDRLQRAQAQIQKAREKVTREA